MVFEKKDRKKMSKFCPCACRWRCKCLPIKVKKKTHPPFNSGVSIDVKLGMHPKLAINSNETPPPGYYNPKPINPKSTHVTSWKREEVIKEFAATMGGRIPEKYTMQRRLIKSGLGPGTHELKQWPEFILEKNLTELNWEKGFGGSPRFKNLHRKATPGPGYTGKDHNPYYFIDKNRFKSYSNLPSFEFDGLAPRLKNPDQKWSIASNRYNPQYPYSLDNFLKKITSLRGPYDLFTGPRDRSTLSGYQIQSVSIDSKNWPFKFPTKFETAYNGSNRYKGIWTNCPRFTKKPTIRSMLEDISLCYKDPDLPGPGFYNPISPSSKSITKMIHPFNNSVKNARPSPYRGEINPGPGTYNLITNEKHIPGNGWTWTFKSKVKRSLGPKPDQYNSF